MGRFYRRIESEITGREEGKKPGEGSSEFSRQSLQKSSLIFFPSSFL
jgi:hypothetical protein